MEKCEVPNNLVATVQKYYSKDPAKKLIICASMLGAQNWEQGGWIDEKIAFLCNFERLV
jgi:hypothetical protein